MSICRQYLLVAKEAKSDDLRSALILLTREVKRLDGCEGLDIYQDADAATQFPFIEHWTSLHAHRSAGERLSKDVFAAVRPQSVRRRRAVISLPLPFEPSSPAARCPNLHGCA
ncbi:antibiotic biosynthesis monooxygenase [Sphingobium bisphenolivorans]|uniref:putative quinol monooxygenase n=1 Tax=Sphingobium bisphenolivorans TaxID=1335760 RepID=UPI000686093F